MILACHASEQGSTPWSGEHVFLVVLRLLFVDDVMFVCFTLLRGLAAGITPGLLMYNPYRYEFMREEVASDVSTDPRRVRGKRGCRG